MHGTGNIKIIKHSKSKADKTTTTALNDYVVKINNLQITPDVSGTDAKAIIFNVHNENCDELAIYWKSNNYIKILILLKY